MLFFIVATPILIILGPLLYIRVCQWEWAICNPELAAGFIGASILIAGLFSVLWTLYTMRRTRMGEMAMRILQLWQTGSVFEARILRHDIIENQKQDFCKTVEDYRLNQVKLYFLLGTIPSLLEFTGWLAREKSISAKWLADLLPIEEYYTDWEKLIKQYQKEQGVIENGEEATDKANAYFDHFVWLNKEIQKLSLSKRQKICCWLRRPF